MASFAFKVDSSSYKKWLQTTGTKHSRVSVLAFDMMQRQIYREEEPRCGDWKALQTLFHSPDCRATILNWRYKPLNLDFLQFAVVCESYHNASRIVLHHMYSEEHYQGDGVLASETMLLNHPVHIAKFLRRTDILNLLLYYMPSVPWKDGYVCLEKACMPFLQRPRHFQRKKVKLTPFSVILSAHEPSILFAAAVEEVIQHPEEASASTIEWIWDMACTGRDPEGLHQTMYANLLEVFNRHPRNEDILSIFFHIYVGELWDHLTPSCRPSCFPVSPSSPEQYRRMAQFLKQDKLLAAIAALRRRLQFPSPSSAWRCSCFRFGRWKKPEDMAELLKVLETEKKERTLQQLCILSVLQQAGGDFRKVLDLDMPWGLRRLFRIPFHELYLQVRQESAETSSPELAT